MEKTEEITATTTIWIVAFILVAFFGIIGSLVLMLNWNIAIGGVLFFTSIMTEVGISLHLCKLNLNR